ncbi:hypothetical protein ACFPYI_02200 [Halomarina salina]|uniref:DUF7344 domain-containing protein n=1 Tax=Halomarina salina TaxID=1872699 RepID=A0ABD5RIE3_9EURY|nr:hypothetical protein [Halomarina salina]
MSEVSDVDAERELPRVGSRTATALSTAKVVSDDGASETAPPPQSAVFSILKNSRRRHVLKFLLEEQRRVSLAELAVHIAAHENDIPTGAVTSAQRKRVYVSLYQSHLPKLDEVGAVDYNDARKYATADEHLDAFRPYLHDDPDDHHWSRWYLGLGLVGVAGATAGYLGNVRSALFADGLLLVLAVGFLTVALYQSYHAFEGA